MRRFLILPALVALCGLFSSCALRQTGVLVRAEMCDNSSCRLMGLPEERRIYKNCLLVERQYEDGTPYQVVECLPNRREAPEFLGEFITASVYEVFGPVDVNTRLCCRVMPELGMDCWPSEQALSEEEAFTVYLLQFPADLREKGLAMAKGEVFSSCIMYDNGEVGCYVVNTESPDLSAVYFTASPSGFSAPALLPYGTDLFCEYQGAEQLRCSPVY